MNPFDLNGPQFLVFYSALFLCSGAVVYFFWRSLGIPKNSEAFRPLLTDPYKIAYLRGGPKEAVKVAAVSLTHRGYAKVDGDTITGDTVEAALATNEFEKAVLHACLVGATFPEIAKSRAVRVAEGLYHKELVNNNLILSDSQRQAARLIKATMIISLLVVAGIKIDIALQRGHHNILYLIMLAIIGSIAHAKCSLWYTPSGRTTLKDLKVLFGRLESQRRDFQHAGQNHDFSFLVAVFGVEALTTTEYAFISAFKPKPGGDSGCGSSSSSGCGGGCGGCGG